MSQGPAIELEGVQVRYPARERVGLDVPALQVGRGERVLVLGPSGGGKSTLLHCLTGVVPQSVDAEVRGDLRVLGQDPRRVPVARLALGVGWLGQDPAAGVALPTVEAEVAFSLENRGVPRGEIGPRVDAALAAVGAGHLRARRAGALSGGEQQRVALAAVLVGDPDLLVLDEPTSMLDPVGAAQVLRVLGEQSERADRTTVLVEHRLAAMPWQPERAVLIGADGRLGLDGPTDRVLAQHPPRRAGPRRRRAGSTTPGGEGEVALRLRGATFHQGGAPVVRDVDLDLRRGQVTVVLGCNGSGKSSLLLGAAGLLAGPGERWVAPAGPAGAAGVAAVPGAGRPHADGAVGLVFQRPEHQLLGRTVVRDLAAGLLPRDPRRRRAPRGATLDEALARAVQPWLDRLGLTELAEADPFRLSGGQQRRLSVGSVALLGRPVLLLDEPTFGLDAVQTDVVAALVDELAAEGTALALATHDLDLARELADQVLVLRGGTVLARGGRELLEDAALLQTAGLEAPAVEPPALGASILEAPARTPEVA